MRRALTWLGFVFGGLVALVMVAAGAVYGLSSLRMTKTYATQPATVAVPTDAEAIARGQHLAVAVGKCTDCHGQVLAGGIVIDDPAIGRIVASNLTKGKGGIGGQRSDADFVRAIRHGLKPDGTSVIFMPAQEFYHFSDADLGALIVYIKSVPPVDNELPAITVGPMMRALFLAGQVDLLPAELIDHAAPHPAAPEPGVTVAYGEYLAQTGGCLGCHGPGLSGGPVPGTPPSFPPARNITPAGRLGQWSEADFIRAMRTGIIPGGESIDEFMPWKSIGQLTDNELKAMWMYLQSVPPRPYGNR